MPTSAPRWADGPSESRIPSDIGPAFLRAKAATENGRGCLAGVHHQRRGRVQPPPAIRVGRYLVFRKAGQDVIALRLPVLVAFILVLLGIAGCSTGSEAEQVQPEPPSLPQELPEAITVAVASTDLAVGDNRVVFGLIRQGKGPIKDAQVSVETFLLTDSGPDGPRQTLAADYQVWPGGSGGVYVVDLSFDETGEWGLGFRLRAQDGSESQAGTRVQVKSESATPALGSAAPRSQNKTSRTSATSAKLTTDIEPDPDLYAKTIAEALDEGRPLVVSFATPPTARPQPAAHSSTCSSS